MKNNMKKKILVVALVAIVLVMSIAGTTIAYFTDNKDVDNTFTVGEVTIDLYESLVKADDVTGNIVKAEGTTDQGINYGEIRSLFPGQSIYKDPTIKNTGSESAYVGVVITIHSDNNNLSSLFVDDNNNPAATIISKLSANCTIEQVEHVDGKVLVYIVCNTALVKDATLTIFEEIKIPGKWDNDDMNLLRDTLTINVHAYAVQSLGFETASGALAEGFPNEFGFLVTP